MMAQPLTGSMPLFLKLQHVQGPKCVAPPPPYSPNPWAEIDHILATANSRDSIKGQRGDFRISIHEPRYSGIKQQN